MKIFLYHNELGQYEIVQDNGNGIDIILAQFPDLISAENKYKELIKDKIISAHKKTLVSYTDGNGHVIDHRSGKRLISGKEYLNLDK
jgi:hypothetical protein